MDALFLAADTSTLIVNVIAMLTVGVAVTLAYVGFRHVRRGLNATAGGR